MRPLPLHRLKTLLRSFHGRTKSQLSLPTLRPRLLNRQRQEIDTVVAEEAPVAPQEGALVVCRGLVKIYKVADLETVALQGLDLDVLRGEMLAVVGNSGSGKTTLLNIVGGLDRPSAGRVWVDGQNLLELSDRALSAYRREMVGFVWQQSARNLIPYLSILENVRLPQMLAGQPASTAYAWSIELLQAVGLGDRLEHTPTRLSGGEQQRAAIAVAMANRPRLILADEPTGEVDTETAAVVYDTLRRMRDEFGATIVIVTHDRNVATQVDRVVAVRDGKVSTETTRRQSEATLPGKDVAEHLEELVVVDAAGRLQIPAELVERFGLKGRVRVEAADGHIAIIPADRTNG